jgi:hypothetical protein
MRFLTLLCAATLLLPNQANAGRFKNYAVGSSSSVSQQNKFFAPSPYSRGGSAKTVFSFTTSPMWALVGLAKFKGEMRLFSRLSLALQAAGGYSVPHDQATIGVGGQVALYVSGNFDRGFSLGGNLMRFGSMLDPQQVLNKPWDAFRGVFIGWKSTAANRNVLELQLGAQQWLRGEGSPKGAADPSIVPTLGLNYGWAW